MLSSKLFSLLTLAAAAVGQNIPSGDYFISHTSSLKVLAVENKSVLPGAFIVLSDLSHSDAQTWSYSNKTGVFTNKASNLVIEVPRTGGNVRYGTRLVQAKPRNETNDDLIQIWAYDKLQHLSTVAFPSACISANSSQVYVVVNHCDSNGFHPAQKWIFRPA